MAYQVLGGVPIHPSLSLQETRCLITDLPGALYPLYDNLYFPDCPPLQPERAVDFYRQWLHRPGKQAHCPLTVSPYQATRHWPTQSNVLHSSGAGRPSLRLTSPPRFTCSGLPSTWASVSSFLLRKSLSSSWHFRFASCKLPTSAPSQPGTESNWSSLRNQYCDTRGHAIGAPRPGAQRQQPDLRRRARMCVHADSNQLCHHSHDNALPPAFHVGSQHTLRRPHGDEDAKRQQGQQDGAVGQFVLDGDVREPRQSRTGRGAGGSGRLAEVPEPGDWDCRHDRPIDQQ